MTTSDPYVNRFNSELYRRTQERLKSLTEIQLENNESIRGIVEESNKCFSDLLDEYEGVAEQMRRMDGFMNKFCERIERIEDYLELDG